MYDNIRKFLQFQLTVNVVALCLVFIAACLDGATPLNAIMMLWVNLIMDTMGALALGTEMPKEELLYRKPYKRSAPLISRPMARNILVQSTFQLFVLLLFLYYGPSWLGTNKGDQCIQVSDGLCIQADYSHYSVIFNIFVFCQGKKVSSLYIYFTINYYICLVGTNLIENTINNFQTFFFFFLLFPFSI